jgi:4-hydroxybenzoate polyprenyltransferase
MRLSVFLRLGRVSNLPTVLTNAAVGLMLAESDRPPAWLAVMLAMVLFYVGGMFLNDAFDVRFDREHRRSRPIPAGEATLQETVLYGGAQLLLGIGLLALAAAGPPVSQPGTGLAAGAALAALILLYNGWHKRNPLSPLVMGLCRVMVVVGAAMATGDGFSKPGVPLAASLLCLHLVGLTCAAKQEHLVSPRHGWPLACLFAPPAAVAGWQLLEASRWEPAWPVLAPAVVAALLLAAVDLAALRRLLRRAGDDLPQAVGQLIAAICLLDAMIAALAGLPAMALLCAAGYPLTRALQRRVAGT